MNFVFSHMEINFIFIYFIDLNLCFYLNTIGAGTQNLMRIFLMLSCRVLSSRYQEVWSLAEAPAVGSGAPRTMLMGDGCGDNNMSSKRCAVGRICCGSSLIKYCANFCNCSRCRRDNDSLTGARRHTCCGWKSYVTLRKLFE